MNHKVSQGVLYDWLEEDGEDNSIDGGGGFLSPEEKYAQSQLRVIRETKDYQLDYLRHALGSENGLIDSSPSYQRRLRWSRKKRSLLIESFLLNIPVPPVFLYEKDYNSYEVIDGRQRIEAIGSFLSNGFSLTGLEYWPELDRKKFHELPVVLQRGLLRRSLSAIVLLAETKVVADDGIDVRRVLFDRLNTGGERLNPQELRNALYPGQFNELLLRLARSDVFTATWGIPGFVEGEDKDPSDALVSNPLYSSLGDVELVLRFFALRDAVVNGASGSLRRILDRYMERMYKGRVVLDVEAAEGEFIGLLKRLYELFDGAPFVLPTTGRASRPLYDALMIALSINPNVDLVGKAGDIRSSLSSAFCDPDKYDILVGRGNTIDSVKDRVTLASAIIKS